MNNEELLMRDLTIVLTDNPQNDINTELIDDDVTSNTCNTYPAGNSYTTPVNVEHLLERSQDGALLSTPSSSTRLFLSSNTGFKSSTPEGRNWEGLRWSDSSQDYEAVKRDAISNESFTNTRERDSLPSSRDLGSLESDWLSKACDSTFHTRDLPSQSPHWLIQTPRDFPSRSSDWLIRDYPSHSNVGLSLPYEQFFLGYRACAVESLTYLSNIRKMQSPSCESVRSVDLPGLKRHLAKRESALRRQLVQHPGLKNCEKERKNIWSEFKRHRRNGTSSNNDDSNRVTHRVLSTISNNQCKVLRSDDLSLGCRDMISNRSEHEQEDIRSISFVTQNTVMKKDVHSVSRTNDADRSLLDIEHSRHGPCYLSPMTSRISPEVGQADYLGRTQREDTSVDISNEALNSSDMEALRNTSADSGLDVSVGVMNLSNCSVTSSSTQMTSPMSHHCVDMTSEMSHSMTSEMGHLMTSEMSHRMTSEMIVCALTLSRAAQDDERVRRVLLELFQLMDEEEKEEEEEQEEDSIDMWDNDDSVSIS